MFPYEVIISGREEYKARILQAERQYRHMHMHVEGPNLWERTSFRLGDLLIAAGEQLKHQRVEARDAAKLPVASAR